MQQSGFDRIAKIYDGLAFLVFGKSIRQAQQCFINEIPTTSKILILGGGSGWFLEKLLEVKPASEIWYVEASQKMLEISKVKTNHSARVHFIHGTEDSISTDIMCDVVILNFYLDLFTNESLNSVLGKIKKALKSDSLWLVTDFIDGKKWWQSLLLKVMYRFFQMTCNIETTRLPNWNQQLRTFGSNKLKSKYFYRGFIETTVYTGA